MNQEGLGLGRRGSEASREEQFEDLALGWEPSSGSWNEELLLSGLEWGAPWGISQDKAGER